MASLVVLGNLDDVATPSFTVVDDRRLAFLREERCPAEHPESTIRRRREYGLVPFPVHHVLARQVGETESEAVPVDVVHVIEAFVVDGRVRIAGFGSARAGVGQVVGNPVLGNLRGHGRRFAYPFRGVRQRLLGFLHRIECVLVLRGDRAATHIEQQAASVQFGTSEHVGNREAPGSVLEFVAFKIEPRPRFDHRGLVRLERVDFFAAQRSRVDARIVNRAYDVPIATAQMPQSEYNDLVVAFEKIHDIRFIRRELFPVSINGYPIRPVDDRDLDGFGTGQFFRSVVLFLFRTREVITARHPLVLAYFGEDNGIEFIPPLKRQNATRRIVAFVERHPRHKRLVSVPQILVRSVCAVVKATYSQGQSDYEQRMQSVLLHRWSLLNSIPDIRVTAPVAVMLSPL